MPKLAPAENQEPMNLWGREAADTGKVEGGGELMERGGGIEGLNQDPRDIIYIITKELPHVFN